MRRRAAVGLGLALALAWAAGESPALGQQSGARSPSVRSSKPAPSGAPADRSRSGRKAEPSGDSSAPKGIAPAAGSLGDLKGEQQRLQRTQKQLQDEREKAAQARRREGSVLAELEQVTRRLAEKQREVAQLDTRIRGAQTQVNAMRREIAKLEGRRALQEVALARRLQAMYKVQVQGGTVPVLLSEDDPITRAVALRHLATLAVLDAKAIQAYRETSEDLAERKSRSHERERELTDLRAQAAREGAEVDQEAARRRTLLAKVRDERSYHERMVGDLTEASQRLEAFIRDLQARQRQAAAKATPPKPPSGGAPPPAAPSPGAPAPASVAPAGFRGRLTWPTAGRITMPFGSQVHPRFGTRTFRSGVDIEAAEGTGVEAVLAGQVVYTGWFKGYGNLIIIDHGDELFTLYAHVSEIHVRDGEAVRQGQRIGAVGETGSLSGPRLYFEVRYRGRPQDPEQWLRQRG